MKTLAIACVVAACVFANGLVESGSIGTRFTISFNSVLDSVIDTIHKNATGFGLNPYNVDDINETFKFGLIKGGLYLENGKIYGIDTIYRTGNSTANLQSGKANVTVALAFSDLTYKMDYVAQVGIIKPKGKVHGEITKLFVDVVAIADLKNTSDITIYLEKFHLKDKGELTVHFDNSNPVAEDLLDVITDTIVMIFKNLIIKQVEKAVGKVANSTLSKMHIDMNSLNGI